MLVRPPASVDHNLPDDLERSVVAEPGLIEPGHVGQADHVDGLELGGVTDRRDHLYDPTDHVDTSARLIRRFNELKWEFSDSYPRNQDSQFC
jgi:hypothetical protein